MRDWLRQDRWSARRWSRVLAAGLAPFALVRPARALIIHEPPPHQARQSAVDALKFWGSELPPGPPQTGDQVRLGHRRYVLGQRLDGSYDEDMAVFAVRGRPDMIIQFASVGPARGASRPDDEASALAAMDRTDIPHSRLVDYGAGGRVVVKRLAPGEPGQPIIRRGPLSERQLSALVDLAARYIRIGYTGDLQPSNLRWNEPQGQWIVRDAAGFRPGSAGRVLDELFAGSFGAALEPGRFLSRLRGRLGPTSGAWTRAQNDALFSPAVEAAFKALQTADGAAGVPVGKGL